MRHTRASHVLRDLGRQCDVDCIISQTALSLKSLPISTAYHKRIVQTHQNLSVKIPRLFKKTQIFLITLKSKYTFLQWSVVSSTLDFFFPKSRTKNLAVKLSRVSPVTHGNTISRSYVCTKFRNFSTQFLHFTL